MGNQREIQQVLPRKGLGVIILVREGRGAALVRRVMKKRMRGDRYTYFLPSGEPFELPNLDGPDVSIAPLPYDRVVIQSGGKMWCGYENFVDWIRALAPYLSDALFYVGDEVAYVDEFRLSGGELHYRRVHEGGWTPVDTFLETFDQA